MARVFLSYDRDDTERARPVAVALEKAGHSVWWDIHIRGGEQYAKVIDEALKAADAVVVLWSKNSIESAWVRDEAAVGRDSGRLVPVSLDDTEPPLGFRQFQTIDLSDWRGRGKPTPLKSLFADIEAMLPRDFNGEAPILPLGSQRPMVLPQRRFKWAVISFAIVLAAIGAFVGWKLLWPSASATSVAVAAVNPGAEPLARDLVVSLAALQSARSGFMKLIDRDEAKSRADLIFEIDGDVRSPKPAANIVLMTGRDRAILWSGDFEQKAGGAADLKQQAGYTAARVLGCALDAMSPANGQLRQSVLKLYLNACAALDEAFFHDASRVIPILERVTAEAPGFKPAWAKLLVARTNHFQNMNASEQTAYAGALRQTIAGARQVDPDIPEAYIAEIELLPGGAFYDQVRLIDRAAKIGPDNIFVLAGRSLVMLGVGRLDEAVKDARRAASLDPLSPAIRSSYIQALIYSGRIETARSELAESERVWPGATTITDSRYRLDLRYGDLAEAANALKLMQSGKVKAGRTREAFIRARLEPTQANIGRAVELAMSAHASRPEIDTASEVIHTLGEFDRTEELLNFLLAWKDANQVPYFVEILFRLPLADLRADPRFMQIAARFGLLDYWQRSGNWPDFCSDPDLAYDCKAEAAKLAA